MTRQALSRRAVLRGLGGVAIGLPLLDAMNASAQTTPSFPKRFIVVFSADGTVQPNWVPTGTETSFTLSPILGPLAPYQSKLLILHGVNMVSSYNGPGDGHQCGMGHMLTGTELQSGTLFTGGNGGTAGWAGGISVDQAIANVVGTQTKFSSLQFGVQVQGATVWSRMSYTGPAQPLPPENDPSAAFTRIFGSLGSDPFGIAKLQAQRKSVLDSVIADYSSLNQRLGASDQQRLDAHLTAIRDIETRLSLPGGQLGGSCQMPSMSSLDPNNPANFGAIGQLQMDLLAMSLACDLTRVASLQWSQSVSNVVHTWLNISMGHHDLSHEPDSNTTAQNQLTQINNWYAQQFAYLLGKLDSIPEGSGTMLDNTAVLWGNELGIGNTHTRDDVPWVVAGSCGGYFKTGRYIEFNNVPHNNMHVSLMNAMGIPATTFGNPAYCTGPLSGVT
jgi:hypothetical protein